MYNKRKSSSVTIVTADYKTVPWAEADKIWKEAADTAEATALIEHTRSYERFLAKKAEEYSSVNEAPYEGNFSEEYPLPPIPNRAEIRRRAGNKALVTDFIPRYNINQWGLQYLSQITTMISRLPVVTLDGEDHLSGGDYYREFILDSPIGSQDMNGFSLSAVGFLNKHFNTPIMKGIYRFLMLDAKSSYLPKQYAGEARSYCALVPIIMFAHKHASNIPYSYWDKSEVHTLMPYELYKAATCKLPDLEKGEILQLRELGLKWRTGDKAGTLRNAEFTHTLYGVQDTVLKDIPELARVMLTQIWCAHPNNRTKYMILDPNNWDAVPPSVITPEVLFDPNPQKAEPVPWMI